jgi:hypothetical protein
MSNQMRLFFYLTVILTFGGSMAADNKVLLAIMPTGENFDKVFLGIKSDLGGKYAVEKVDVEKKPTAAQLVEKCYALKVSGIILMLAKEMQNIDAKIAAMPKFVFMTLQVAMAANGLQNVSGIRFEVPGFTLITNFRTISKKDFSSVGVFYRQIFAKDIEEGKRLLAKEKINLITGCLDCDLDKPLTPDKAFDRMENQFGALKSQNIEVMWILPDNYIVNSKTVSLFWLKKVKQAHIPAVAPIENLTSLGINAAIFSADPDYLQLGIQGAGQIVQVFEEETDINTIGFEPLISVKLVLNKNVAKELHWDLAEDKLERINKILSK